jgi:SAM-dependent methyltransferase
MSDDISLYLSGMKLYGNDFPIDRIAAWFDDEKEGYADLGARDRASYRYLYRTLDWLHGYRHLGSRSFRQALGIGAAYGEEFIPLADRIQEITILDPSDAFAVNTRIKRTPCRYEKPTMEGCLPFEDQRFDLITSFSVLHHIPNVSYVLRECFRCLARDGRMLIREPIISMGDWTKPRRGLTKNERGIPLNIFEEIIGDAGFTIKRRSLCIFPAIPKLTDKLGIAAYNTLGLTLLDAVLCLALRRNTKYHRTTIWQKLGPANVYFVLAKGKT